MGWLMYSGANQHFVKSYTNLENIVDISIINLIIEHPNSTRAKITEVGNYKISNNSILFYVLVIPDYMVNLLSVYKLVRVNNNMLVSINSMGKAIVIGKQQGWTLLL